MMKFLGRAASLGFLAVLFYYPLATVFVRGAAGKALAFVFDARTLELIWFTIWQALVSATGATVIGLLFAYLLYRKYFWGQELLRALFTVPFVLPVIVISMAFTTFQISNVILAILLSHIYINAPLVARAVGSQWLSLSADIDDAAELDGASRLTTFLKITIFELRSVIIASFVLAFTYCSSAFATVLLLGNGLVNSIETAIYNQVFSYLDLSAATGLAFVQLLLTLATFWLSSRLVQGNVGFGNSVGISAKRLDRRDTPLAVLGIALFTLFVLPIWNVFQKVFSEDSKIGIDSELLIAAANSARNILIVVLLSGMIGTYVAYQLVRTSGWLQKLLSFSYLAPIGISTVLVGLGYLLGFSSLRSSWLVIPLAETVLALPLVVRIVASALAAVEESQLEQAKVDGASLWQIFRFVEAPAISNSVRAGLGFAAIIALGDFGASAFLSFGDQETLPILLYRLFSRPGAENYQNAMSLTALLVIASIALVLVTSIKVGRRNQRAFR